MKFENHNLDEQSILTLIQRAKDGLFDPKILNQEQRHQFIEVLISEGLAEATIAQFLKVSTKTITRDLKAIRNKNAIIPNVELAKQICGELLYYARIHHSHLMRLARSKDASISDRIQAEYSAWKVRDELAARFQLIGYLPTKAKEISGDLTLHFESNESFASFEDLKKQLQEIEAIGNQQGGLPEETQTKIKLLRQKIEKAELEQNVIEIKEMQPEGGNDGQQDENKKSE